MCPCPCNSSSLPRSYPWSLKLHKQICYTIWPVVYGKAQYWAWTNWCYSAETTKIWLIADFLVLHLVFYTNSLKKKSHIAFFYHLLTLNCDKSKALADPGFGGWLSLTWRGKAPPPPDPPLQLSITFSPLLVDWCSYEKYGPSCMLCSAWRSNKECSK